MLVVGYLDVFGVLFVIDKDAKVADRVVEDAKELKVARRREVDVGGRSVGAGGRDGCQALLEEVAETRGQLVGDDERVVALHPVRAEAERLVLQIGVQKLE